ncbi:hypothetical protein [Sphingomonas hankookensis]|nr:hypothetical protein [Sphingomonas hankookensis]
MAKDGGVIRPPAHVQLEEQDEPFWRSVIAEFARSEWTDHQLELAAMLARKMSDLEALQRQLRTEGFTTMNASGSPMSNPLIQSVRMFDASILSTRRSLSLHARASAGEPRDVAKRRAAAKGIEADNAGDDDDLLARPSLQ